MPCRGAPPAPRARAGRPRRGPAGRSRRARVRCPTLEAATRCEHGAGRARAQYSASPRATASALDPGEELGLLRRELLLGEDAALPKLVELAQRVHRLAAAGAEAAGRGLLSAGAGDASLLDEAAVDDD